MSDSLLSQLLSAEIQSRLQRHRQDEQQQVDALLASQKHLTSNLRTLINSLDIILQLSIPRYNSSQGDLISSCLNRARALDQKLHLAAARLARVQEHLEDQHARQQAELNQDEGVPQHVQQEQLHQDEGTSQKSQLAQLHCNEGVSQPLQQEQLNQDEESSQQS